MRVLLLLYLATAILVELIDDSVNFVFVRILTSSSERLVQLLMGTIVMMMITMMITFVLRMTVAKDVAYLCGDVTILIVVKVIKCLTVPYYKTIYVFASSKIIHHLIKHIICYHRSMSSAGKPGMPVLGAMLLLKLVIMINIMPSTSIDVISPSSPTSLPPPSPTSQPPPSSSPSQISTCSRQRDQEDKSLDLLTSLSSSSSFPPLC